MKFLRLQAKNLFSLGEVDIDLEGRGLTLVTGYSHDEGSSNGAGKSSLANKALLWVLWGETAGGIRADQVGNRHRSKGCFGAVTFMGGNGEVFTVRRSRPAELVLLRGDVDVSAKTAKDTQVQIDQALGIDFKTFIQTSFFGQGRQLSYASLTPKDQKAVLESILPMEEVDKWGKYADEQYRRVNLEYQASEQALRTDITRCESLQDERARMDGAAAAYEAGRKRHLLELTDRLAGVDARYADERDQLEILKKQLNVDVEADLASISVRRKELMIEHANAKQKSHEADRAHDYWSARHKYLRDEIGEITKNKSCPTCLRSYDDTTVEAIQKRIDQTQALITEADANQTSANQAAEYWDHSINSVAENLEAIERTHVLLTEDLNRKKKIESMEASLDQRQASAKAMIEGEFIQVQRAENPIYKQMEDADQRLDLLKARVESSRQQYETLQGEAEHLDYWRNVYAKEMKLKLFEEACPFLDSRVTHHLKKLGNGQIHVEFSTIKRLASGAAKEEFNVNVWSETGGYGFDSLSGGEQQMVSFAIGLGLADLAGRAASGRSSFLILDEPFAELDARNSESIVSYLGDEVRNGKDTIFLISNDEALKGLIQERIHVVKKHGISGVSNG
ncbi:MAG: AAA family ATPase [Nitrososphaera sp.]|nr:AAA family ATPase [Nitrososphaera sp.]